MRLSPHAQDESKQSMVEDVLRQNGSLRMRVFGQSMLPSIWPGDIVTVEGRPVLQLAVGDIGLFRRNGRFFVHRVRDVFSLNCSLQFEARGDSSNQSDPPFHQSEVLGKVVSIQGSQTDTPVRDLTCCARMMGWILCHSDRLRNLAMRFHQANRAPTGDWETPDRGQSRASMVFALK
jgi:hypothetical protein